MDDIDTEEYVKRINELNEIKDRYEFTTSVQPRLDPQIFIWDFIRDEEYRNECDTLLRIMECEESWQKLKYSKILVQNKIINPKSAVDILNQMAAKNFQISHLLKVCIDDNLLPYPSDTVSFLHNLNYGYELLKLVKDIETSNDRVRRTVHGVVEEFHVLYAKLDSVPLAIQAEFSGIPSPRYQWFYRPYKPETDREGAETEFEWTHLSDRIENLLYFDPFSFGDSGYYYCRVQHNLCVVGEVTKEKLDDWTTSKKIFLRPEKGGLMITKQPVPAECSFGGSVVFDCAAESFEELSFQWFKDDNKLIGEDGAVLKLSNLTSENTGHYHCLISTEFKEQKSYSVSLSVTCPPSPHNPIVVDEPPPTGVGDVMVIRSQPTLPTYARQPMPIGEKINLKFDVSCGRPVVYEWLKQGMREDVTVTPAEVSVRATIIPVATGRELNGEVVEGGDGITCWQYVCRAHCPATGEMMYSDVIKIRVAKATTNECSFPKFKIALVICEEKYRKSTQFPALKATRNDGDALIRVLQELHFQVLAFTNLTLEQMRNAIDLFASFIDEETYALFYYNGHAVGHNEDIYLASVETSLDEHDPSPLSQVLLHHGHVESVVSDKNPLLGVIIYDSCRDDPKEFLKKKLDLSKQQGYIMKSNPNLIIGYGTMPNMKAFEENDFRTGAQIGIYMKHILNHIHKKDLDIERVLKNVQTDFQKNTSASICEKMKPEYRSSLGQEMYLGANLRQKKATLLQKAFFRLTRPEYLFPPFLKNSSGGRFEFPQGIKWNGDDTNISWVHGQVQADNGLDGVLTLMASPSVFFNECEIKFTFHWRSAAPLPADVNVQIVGRNVPFLLRSMYVDKINGQQQPLETTYQPCSKDRKDTFLTKDGPLFKLREGTVEYPDIPIIIFGLQDLKDRVKLLLILRTNDQVLVAPGIVSFPLPILEHTDNLKIKDKKSLYAGIMQNL